MPVRPGPGANQYLSLLSFGGPRGLPFREWMPEVLQAGHPSLRLRLDRRDAILLSLSATVILNTLAGILTMAYANGTTIVETNPLSGALLETFGPGTLLVHAILIALVYPLIYMVSRTISSTHRLFRSKRILLFAFALMVAVLPMGALVDLSSDLLVVSLGSDILVGSQKIVLVALVCAIPFALLQVRRGWTLGVGRRSITKGNSSQE